MTLQRTKTTSTGIAAFRDADTSFVCLDGIAGDPSAFRRVVMELATSIQPARRTADVALVRLCRLRLADGSVGFERWEVSKRGPQRISTVTSSLAYRYHDGIAFMEFDGRDAIDPRERTKDSTLVRMVGGKLQVRSAIRHRGGADYEYEVFTAEGSTSGRFRTKRSTGLDSSIAITRRLSGELISGRAPTLTIGSRDPFSPQKGLIQVDYSLLSRTPPTVYAAQGPRHSHRILDDNGFMKSAETTLSGNEKLISECETQRGALPTSPSRQSAHHPLTAR